MFAGWAGKLLKRCIPAHPTSTARYFARSPSLGLPQKPPAADQIFPGDLSARSPPWPGLVGFLQRHDGLSAIHPSSLRPPGLVGSGVCRLDYSRVWPVQSGRSPRNKSRSDRRKPDRPSRQTNGAVAETVPSQSVLDEPPIDPAFHTTAAAAGL